MNWDSLWGNTSFKIGLSVGLGLLFSYLVPSSWLTEMHKVFGYRILRYLPFLLGFPVVVFLEEVYMSCRESFITKLIRVENYDEAGIFINYLAEVNPQFHKRLLKKLDKSWSEK